VLTGVDGLDVGLCGGGAGLDAEGDEEREEEEGRAHREGRKGVKVREERTGCGREKGGLGGYLYSHASPRHHTRP
jgi:hypothetical protein